MLQRIVMCSETSNAHEYKKHSSFASGVPFLHSLFLENEEQPSEKTS